MKEPFRKPASAVSKLFLNCTLCYDIKNSSIHKGNENMSACRQYVRTDTNKGKEDSKQRRYRKAKWNTIVPFSEIVITVHYPLGYYSWEDDGSSWEFCPAFDTLSLCKIHNDRKEAWELRKLTKYETRLYSEPAIHGNLADQHKLDHGKPTEESCWDS